MIYTQSKKSVYISTSSLQPTFGTTVFLTVAYGPWVSMAHELNLNGLRKHRGMPNASTYVVLGSTVEQDWETLLYKITC